MFRLTGHVTPSSIDPSIRCTQFSLNVLSQQSRWIHGQQAQL